MHYRGTAKRRLYRLQADSVLNPLRLLIQNGRESEGEIIASAQGQQETQLLAILPCDSVEGKPVLFSDAGDGEVSVPARLLPFVRQSPSAVDSL
jgi:folate-binding Fe-S cluster repair protein YgfZ